MGELKRGSLPYFKWWVFCMNTNLRFEKSIFPLREIIFNIGAGGDHIFLLTVYLMSP